jgi:hypothetical protein
MAKRPYDFQIFPAPSCIRECLPRHRWGVNYVQTNGYRSQEVWFEHESKAREFVTLVESGMKPAKARDAAGALRRC